MQRQHSRSVVGRARATLLAGALVFAAAACGDDDDNDTDNTVVVPNGSETGVSLPRPTTAGTGDDINDLTDGTTEVGDPMEPTQNSQQVPGLTEP